MFSRYVSRYVCFTIFLYVCLFVDPAAACLLRHGQTIGGRWVGVPRAVSFHGLLSGPASDPPVNISRLVELPSLGQHALPPLLPIEAHGYYRAWVRPLPPRAASRLSGLVRRLRRSSLNSVIRSVGPTSVRVRDIRLKMFIQPITNHQSPH